MSEDTGGDDNPRVVTLPDGRFIRDGDVFSYGEDDRGRTMVYEAAFSAGIFEARPVGGWENVSDNIVFDEKEGFVDWCITPTPPVEIGIGEPDSSLLDRIKSMLGLR